MTTARPRPVPGAPSSGRVPSAGEPSGRASEPTWRTLRDGRLHGSHGPIDLLVEVDAEEAARAAALSAARVAFAPLLGTLAAELAELRRPLGGREHRPRGPVARRMLAAVTPFRALEVTPMAAVAGAVADHVLAAMCTAAPLERVWVNNGGDIALRLAPGASSRVALCGDPGSGRRSAVIELHGGDGVGGIATSGWRGRSHSLGIADAVTVLAASSAAADAAATLIANAVDLPASPAVRRTPARELDPDSDLGDRLVTTAVGALDERERGRALGPAIALARDFLARDLVAGVRLELQSSAVVLGGLEGVELARAGGRDATNGLAAPSR